MDLDTAFCIESGQIKTGDDNEDTYAKMLQEVARVTLPIAYGIALKYPNVLKLVESFEKHGPTALENLQVRYYLRFLPKGLYFQLINPRNLQTRTVP